jgi:hypothetical protein
MLVYLTFINASLFGSIQIPMYGILHAGARVIIEMSFISSNHSVPSVYGTYDLEWEMDILCTVFVFVSAPTLVSVSH